MTDVTQILNAIEQGDPCAAEQLLPLVYDELRELAAANLAQEKPGQTLQATALVHKAYLQLVDIEKAGQWDSRGPYFSAAAEAMRRILVDGARRKRSLKRGSGYLRQDFDEGAIVAPEAGDDILPVPKVIDFGVSKATSQQLTEKTLFTAYGQMVGTPICMSPEQAQMSGLDVDTRSDIYSLGVMLFELLTGSTPLDAEQLRKSGYGLTQRPSATITAVARLAGVLRKTGVGQDYRAQCRAQTL